MNLPYIFKHFRDDTSGAVTVDWVVLTAAVAGIGVFVITTFGGGITGVASSTGTDLSKRTVLYAAP